MTRLKIIILSLICLLAVVILSTIRFIPTGEEETFLPMETEADLTSKNFHLVGDRSGLKEWELEAKEAWHFQDGKMTMLEDIEAAFYIEEGGLIRLRGDHGRILHSTRDIELQGNIIIFTADGCQLTTEDLNYVNRTRKIKSSKRVDITGRGMEITGRDMCIDLVTGKLTMKGSVDTILFDAFGG
ncbi:MAG: LPS export ABC transporter periplasmic protein LptC [Syntrophobacterales bacterium]|nr:MAG: LPS export ABC transporter periplasmic protein LptC [Syntrophobacterales bacterium]